MSQVDLICDLMDMEANLSDGIHEDQSRFLDSLLGQSSDSVPVSARNDSRSPGPQLAPRAVDLVPQECGHESRVFDTDRLQDSAPIVESPSASRAMLPAVLPRLDSHPLSGFGFSRGQPRSRTLASRSEQLQHVAEAHDTKVKYIGTMPLFSGHRVAHGRQYDWVMTSVAEDPLFREPGGIPLPRRVREDLQRVHDAEIDFDTLYIAHEVMPGAVDPLGPLTLEAIKPPPPRNVRELSHGLGELSSAVWSKSFSPLRATPWLLGVAAVAAIAALPVILTSAAAVPTAIALDPIILGVLTRDGRLTEGDEASFFYITHWTYGEE